MYKEIYFKTEPAGEIGFGQLNENDIEAIKSLINSKEMKDSDYVEGPHNFCQDAAYGVFISDKDTIDGELPQYQITETISFLKNRRYEDGWYMVHTALSKGSIQFEFEPAGGSFDINELVVQLTKVDLNQLSDDLYGELNFTVLSDFQYQGESINEYYDAELVDRGLDREVHIVEIKDGEFNLVYKNRNIEDESYYEGGVLVTSEDKSLDRDQALAAVSNDGFALEGLDEAFKKDKEIVLAAINEYGGAFEYAHETLKKDKEILLASLAEHVFAMEDTDDSFKKDREFVMEALNINGNALEFIDESFKKDKEIVKQALRQNGEAFEYADASLKNDKDFVMEAVCIDGNAVLYCASESLQDDKEVVLAAIKQNPDAINHASDNLQNDPILIKASEG